MTEGDVITSDRPNSSLIWEKKWVVDNVIDYLSPDSDRNRS